MPRVSVIVPNYNYGRYLDERIESILAQTLSDYELIIVDDGSTDDSVAIIKKYTDERIRTKFFERNGGKTFRCHNVGAQMARGDYLIFAESDDSCHPRLLEHLAGVLDSRAGVGCVSAGSLHCLDIDFTSVAARLKKQQIREAATDLPTRAEHLSKITVGNCLPCASSVMVRRSLFEEVGGFDTDLAIAADWKLWWECALRSDVAFIRQGLNYWRRHDAAASTIWRWEAARTLVTEDAILSRYFMAHPDVAGKLSRATKRLVRTERARLLWLVIAMHVRSWGRLRQLAPAYRNLRQLDRYFELWLLLAGSRYTWRSAKRSAKSRAKSLLRPFWRAFKLFRARFHKPAR